MLRTSKCRHFRCDSDCRPISSGRRSGQRFDAAYNVTTEALIFLGQLDPEAVGPGIEHATHYEPTPLADFEACMKAVPADCTLPDTTFVDIGSGMGRVVLLASHYPFKQILGVEISPALHEIARENLANYRDARQHCRDVRLIRADAGSYTLPGGNVLLYLYNPFEKPMLERFVRQLTIRSAAYETVLVYHTPVGREVIEQEAAFTLVSDLGFAAIYRSRLTQKG